MKNIAIFTFVMVSMLALGANALAGGDGQAGKAVFDSKCKMCHGADGKGNPMLAKTMKVTFPDMTSKDVQGKSDAVIKKQITEGGGKMKSVNGLSDQQIQDVIAFVRTLKA